MITLDKRQRMLLLGILGVILLIVTLLLLPLLASEKDPEGESLVAVIPDAELEKGEDSKLDSYRKGGAVSEWKAMDEMERSKGGQDSAPGHITVPDPGGSPAGGRSRPEAVTVKDVFGNGGRQESAGRRSAASERKDEGETEDKPQQKADGQGDGEDAPEETPGKGDSARPLVKRSGAVSSLDEDVSGDLGNGFSTLDGTERWVSEWKGKPYRCMFTRDEKVKSGQRITLRLLEDLVIEGVHIPRNTHLQGTVQVTGRMEIRVTSLDMGGRILNFHFEAFDTDGGKGIYCSDLGSAGKRILDQGLSTVSSTLSSRLGRVARDAASVGASIIRDKSGEATVTVPAGYTFYLMEGGE